MQVGEGEWMGVRLVFLKELLRPCVTNDFVVFIGGKKQGICCLMTVGSYGGMVVFTDGYERL
jgi:hypothetical protein